MAHDCSLDDNRARRGDEYCACASQQRASSQHKRCAHIRDEEREIEEHKTSQGDEGDLRAPYPGEYQGYGGDQRE